MNQETFIKFVQGLVADACILKDKYTEENEAKVNYACIFAQNLDEYDMYCNIASQLGTIVKNTPTGPLFQVSPIDTVSGKLQLVKVRKPDPTRTERGDADFTVFDYGVFKDGILGKQGVKVIERPEMEMIELMEESADVRVYFSNPPLDKQLGLLQTSLASRRS